MHIIICMDDNLGMFFGKRRQSQDRRVREDIIHNIGEKKLWMNAYSQKQFADTDSDSIVVSEDFLKLASDDYCFVENNYLNPFEKKSKV